MRPLHRALLALGLVLGTVWPARAQPRQTGGKPAAPVLQPLERARITANEGKMVIGVAFFGESVTTQITTPGVII